MARRIIAYLLFGLGFLTIAFFRNYYGHIIPYPVLFWLLGLAMLWGGWYLLRFTETVEESREKKRLQKLIKDLKANGEKIRVDFSECEIKTNDYTEERNRYESQNAWLTTDVEREIQGWNNILGDGEKNIKRVDVHQNVLVFKYYNETFYSRIIPKEIITLRFKLDEKKETTLYVDRKDRSRYYFDLDFLQNKIDN